MNVNSYTTQDAAEAVGITRVILQNWIKKRKFAAPKLTHLGSVSERLGAASDVARFRRKKESMFWGKEHGRMSEKGQRP